MITVEMKKRSPQGILGTPSQGNPVRKGGGMGGWGTKSIPVTKAKVKKGSLFYKLS